MSTSSTRQYGGANLGINFWFDDTSDAYFDSVLPPVAATGCHVKIGVQHKVVVADGYTVLPFDDENFTVIKRAITKSQALGITVDMLMIYMEDSVNYATPINPTGENVASFFNHHQQAALNVAALCNTYQIPILGLVNECSSLTDSDKTSYWAKETAAIKAAYPNLKLTGASTTWNAETKKLLDYKLAGIDNFWNYTDFCGINTYPGLTADVSPESITDADLINEWNNPAYPQQSYIGSSFPKHAAAIKSAFGKSVMVLEIGCCPWERGLYDPLGLAGNTPVNKNVQYRYLKSAYDVLGVSDAIAGIYIWDICDTSTPFYWLDNTELVPYITNYYQSVPAPSPTPTPTPTELLVNGNFTNGSNGWVVDKGKWNFTFGAAVCNSTEGTWNADIFQYVDASPLTQYTLTVGSNTGYIIIGASNSSYTAIGGNLLVLNRQTGVFNFTTPSKTAHLQIVLLNGEYKSNIRFDNLSLKQTKIIPTELLVNGNFSSTSQGWVIDKGKWSFTSGAAVCNSTEGTWNADIFQFVDVLPSTQYTLTVGSNTGYILVGASDASYAAIGGNLLVLDRRTGSFNLTTPAKTAHLQITLMNGTYKSNIRFDNLSLKLSTSSA